MNEFQKYPRTQHLEGSRLQQGDEDLLQVPFSSICQKNLVVEEKIDGANVAISFDDSGKLLLQNRGHFLYGGYRERHYNLFKAWATNNCVTFFEVLQNRYIMYGEWMYAKHTVFYDALPDYFMEFDIFDKQKEVFLDTATRKSLTNRLPMIHSVPVLAEGIFHDKESLLKLLGNSNYITENHLEVLRSYLTKQGLNVEENLSTTDPSTKMEGLYIKVEENGIVCDRVKYVRASYVQCSKISDVRWQSRPIIPNKLKDKDI